MNPEDRIAEQKLSDREPTNHIQHCPVCGLGVSGLATVCPKDGTPLQSTVHRSGQTIARNYELIEQIGSGGMGTVYKAKHLVLNRTVAIKTMHEHKLQGVGIRRFQQEAKAVSCLQHPNIVMIHDFGLDDNGLPYMVLDYLEGTTLADLIRQQGAIELQKSIEIFLQICDGFNHAHSNGILHRDLKPSNIMLVEEPNQKMRIKILDFGIAKIIDSDSKESGLTQTGEIFGSPLYMSPEQVEGKKIDQRSEVYSMGCLMYETLTGAPPFVADTAIATLMKHTTAIPPSLREGSLGKTFPRAIESMVAKALEKDPDKRYQSMSELKSDLLKQARGDYKDPAPAIDGPNSKVPVSRTVLTAIVAVAMIGLGSWLVVKSMSGPPAPAPHGSTGTPKETAVMPASQSSESDSGVLMTLTNPGSIVEEALVAKQNEKIIDGLPVGILDDQLEKLQYCKAAESVNLNQSKLRGEGLRYLAHLTNLKALSLVGSTLSDPGLDEVSKLSGLETLDLSQTRITDSGLMKLTKLKHLASLILFGDHIGDSGLKSISRMPELKQLNISSTNVTSKGISSLRSLPRLEELYVCADQIPAKEFACFKQLKHLSTLYLATPVTDDPAMEVIGSLPLEKLDISQAQITSHGLQKLSHQKNLRSLILRNCTHLSIADITALKKQLPDCDIEFSSSVELVKAAKSADEGLVLPQNSSTRDTKTDSAHIDPMDISNIDILTKEALKRQINQYKIEKLPPHLTDEDLAEFQHYKVAREIDLHGSDVQGAGLRYLVNLDYLKSLNLSFTPLSDVGLAEIAKMERLETLDLSSTKVTDTGLKKLSHLKHLTHLTLDSCRHIGDFGLMAIAHLPGLRDLDVSCTSVTASGIADLRSLPELEKLQVRYDNIPAQKYGCFKLLKHLSTLDLTSEYTSDDSIGILASLPLEKLDVSQAPITNRGLQKLANSKTLRVLVLHSCKNLTESDVAALKKHLPDCDISFYQSYETYKATLSR